MKIQTILGAACAVVAIATAAPASAHDVRDTVTTNFEQAIPNIPGKSLIALIVDYAPGEGSPSHVHAKSAFIYAFVISGAIESQVNDGAAQVYKAGESWFEGGRVCPGKLLHDTNRKPGACEVGGDGVVMADSGSTA